MTELALASLDLSPPRKLAHDEELPLGARVLWHHRAAVIRWRWSESGRFGKEPWGDWWVAEGVPKRSGWRPRMALIPEGESEAVLAFTQDLDPFYERPPRDGNNKTVIVWPEEGHGFVFGLVRRGIGQSVSASGTASMYHDNFEPGYFDAVGYVPLYAVKSELAGVNYMLVPHWAVKPA